jgi:hypothetical protein
MCVQMLYICVVLHNRLGTGYYYTCIQQSLVEICHRVISRDEKVKGRAEKSPGTRAQSLDSNRNFCGRARRLTLYQGLAKRLRGLANLLGRGKQAK